MTEERPQPDIEASPYQARASRDDIEIEEAFRTIAHELPGSSPPAGFSRRVMIAVRRVSLPAGRQKLRSPRSPVITGLGGAAAAAGLLAVVWATGLLETLIAEIFLLAVQAGMFAIRSLGFTLDVWRFIDRVARILTTVLSSPEMLSVVGAAAVLSVLSLAALTHLVSSSQRVTQRESIKW
jgi:hypothetical protein